MNEADFANIYIERILSEVAELTKIRMLNEAKISFIEKTALKNIERINQLEAELEKTKIKINRKKADRLEIDTDSF